jgi:hypothetical protein
MEATMTCYSDFIPVVLLAILDKQVGSEGTWFMKEGATDRRYC